MMLLRIGKKEGKCNKCYIIHNTRRGKCEIEEDKYFLIDSELIKDCKIKNIEIRISEVSKYGFD